MIIKCPKCGGTNLNGRKKVSKTQWSLHCMDCNVRFPLDYGMPPKHSPQSSKSRHKTA